jgi:hypothetical protein
MPALTTPLAVSPCSNLIVRTLSVSSLAVTGGDSTSTGGASGGVAGGGISACWVVLQLKDRCVAKRVEGGKKFESEGKRVVVRAVLGQSRGNRDAGASAVSGLSLTCTNKTDSRVLVIIDFIPVDLLSR